jgi:hypothetical protein
MKSRKWAAAAVFAAAVALVAFGVTPAGADEEEDIYVAPLDEDGSDEALREEASSGFDTSGPFYIDEDDYEAGSPGDGTWDPDVPEPEPSEYYEDDD